MNTQHIALLTLITFAFARSLLGQSVGPDVVVRDMRLFYADNEFFVKGVCYSPSPIAQDDTQADVGYCSAHEYFVIGQGNATEQQSPCYYQDYFDGTSYVGGPPNGFLAVWQRDLPLLQSANVNTLRIYHAFPITSTNVANGGYDQSVQAANHIPFLDLALSYNMKVIFPLFSDEAYLDTLSQEYMELYIRNIIDEVGYHPALLMLQFGNELQFSANGAAYIDKVSGYLTYAKNYQLTRWGRNVPITTALIDNPDYYNSLSSLPVDVFTTNAGYRGFTFTDLWSGNTAQDFSGFYDLSCSVGKPVLIGEMGVHENTPYFDVSSWFPQLWGNLLAHKTQGAIGGCVFEYQDEGWKGLTDGTMGMVVPQPTGPWAVGAFYLDTVTPKTTGAYNWTSIVNTFALDPFGSAGQATLSSASNQYCPAGSPSTPLGVNNNVPSGSIPTNSATVTKAPTSAPTASPTAAPTTTSVTSVPTTPANSVPPTTVSQTTVSPTTVLPSTASPTTVSPSTSAPATSPLKTTTMPTSAATTVLPTTVIPTSTAVPTNSPTTAKVSAPVTTTAMPTHQVTVPRTSTSAPTSASTTNLPTTSRVTLAPTSTSSPTSSSTPASTSAPTSASTTNLPTTSQATLAPASTSAPTSSSTPASTSAPTATSLPTNSPTMSVSANPTSATPTSTTASPTATSTPAVNPTSPATTSPTQQATSVPTAIASTAASTSAPTTPYASSTPTELPTSTVTLMPTSAPTTPYASSTPTELSTSTVTLMPTSTAPPQGKNGAASINALSSMFVAIVVVIASCI